jgi:hypothetical protein
MLSVEPRFAVEPRLGPCKVPPGFLHALVAALGTLILGIRGKLRAVFSVLLKLQDFVHGRLHRRRHLNGKPENAFLCRVPHTGTRGEIARCPGMENPKVQPEMGDGAKQLLAKIIGDGKLFDEPWRPEEKSDYQRLERRPGPFAQDRDPAQLRNPGAS